jgi:hypothetical protein
MLNVHKTAILIVIAYIVLAIGWDVVLAACGQLGGNSFCQACRELNAAMDGLMALLLPGLFIHIFLLPLLPSWWRGK